MYIHLYKFYVTLEPLSYMQDSLPATPPKKKDRPKDKAEPTCCIVGHTKRSDYGEVLVTEYHVGRSKEDKNHVKRSACVEYSWSQRRVLGNKNITLFLKQRGCLSHENFIPCLSSPLCSGEIFWGGLFTLLQR